MRDLYYSDTAEIDLIDLWSYIAVDNKQAADRTCEKIHQTCRDLLTFPKMGRV